MVRFISFVSSVNLYLIEREEEQQQQETTVKEFKSFFTARKGPTITRERKRELDVAFFKMIYMDYEPLSIGEREGMQHFASAAQQGLRTPMLQHRTGHAHATCSGRDGSQTARPTAEW